MTDLSLSMQWLDVKLKSGMKYPAILLQRFKNSCGLLYKIISSEN